ncbi:MAG: hypothetical protein JWL69_3664 [Phycisphaerales bacterium]|nr:hypothetical protein [Phycisphaerales bacterium]
MGRPGSECESNGENDGDTAVVDRRQAIPQRQCSRRGGGYGEHARKTPEKPPVCPQTVLGSVAVFQKLKWIRPSGLRQHNPLSSRKAESFTK